MKEIIRQNESRIESLQKEKQEFEDKCQMMA
jgi:hypothetical protein